MSEEYLDLVDENGNLTGEKQLRSVCHAKGLWHRTVHIYLFRKVNKQTELLINLRSEMKDLAPGKWDPRFGGHVKSGESVEETVVNEIKEEIGLNIEFKKLILGLLKKRNGTTNREYSYVYYLEFNENIDKLSFNDNEIQRVEWINLNEFKKRVLDNPNKWAVDTKESYSIVEDLLEKIA
ncbi:MAG: NUDIX domain-containing protein [Candidatus Moranbacteria bacterium]|nr:NUDIX domain-containing protein [Candidatus Moranbacteria bacterium]